MRITETYDHEPMLGACGEESGGKSTCQCGCNKVGTQCVDVSAPLTFTPVTTVGTSTVTCQGNPSVVCETDPQGKTCTVTVTQRVCVSVPIRYGVTLTDGDPTIVCAENCPVCG